MRIELKQIVMHNFKGIKDLTINFIGNMNIYGDNATGKTSILDAFLWCLFNKNSQNVTSFNVKPLLPDGSELHNQEYSVELVFEINDDEKSFKKVLKENWSRKRGSNETEFSGHTTDYYINSVPVQEKLYKAEVAKLADEEIFKMITNLYYFNQNLSWQKRRQILLELVGNVSDADVIASNKNLKPLLAELEKKTVDELLAIVTNSKKKINDQLKAIPIKIDELLKIDYSEIDGLSINSINDRLSNLEIKRDELIALKSNGDTANQLLQIENERLRIENEIARLRNFTSTKQIKLDEIASEGRSLKLKHQSATDHMNDLNRSIDNAKKEIESLEKTINNYIEKKEELYQQYDSEFAKEFVVDNCSYCGQPLPVHKAEELREKFNLTKSNTIEKIVADGKSLNVKMKEIEEKIADQEAIIKNCEKELDEVIEQAKVLKVQIDAKAEEWKQVNAEPESNPNQAKIDELDTKLAELIMQKRDLQTNTSFNREDELEGVRNEITSLNRKLAMFDLKKQNDLRIRELSEEEQFLTEQYEKEDNLHKLCEEFITTKASLLEDKVNSQFEFVKFKLFETQINGGIKEICEATVNGVPYSDLNHAMQVNAGLDIIQALHKVYNVKAPVFIDNAESITQIKPIDTQIIRLVVSEADKKLRFENAI
ncbi:MAG TPA: DUF2813 domain-containing protein [Bacilli bacterium]|nr:DUF2813 domain-containing protein [Bacilli bacterium]